MAPTFAPPSVSVMRRAVPRFRMCDQVAPGWIVSSNNVFLFSLPVKFFGQYDRFRQFAHRPPEAAALGPQIEVGLFLRCAVAMLQNSFRALNDLSCLERALHFERFGNQSRIFECKCCLAG